GSRQAGEGPALDGHRGQPVRRRRRDGVDRAARPIERRRPGASGLTYSAPVSDLPHAFAPELNARFLAAFDRAGKIVRGLDALGAAEAGGSIADRDVVLVDAT